MTPFDMEEAIKNLNEWAGEIAQILPRLATKDDLTAFATKEDLKAFATKADLNPFVTKDDLKALATKEDVEDVKRYSEDLTLVTRREIRQVDDTVTSIAADVKRIAEHVAVLSARRRRTR